MRLLIDTHILLWADERPRLIVQPLRAAMRDEANEVVVSAATVWEIAIKRAIASIDRSSLRCWRWASGSSRWRVGMPSMSAACRRAASQRSIRSSDNRPSLYLEGMVLGTQDQLMRPYGVATLGLD